MAVRNTPGTAGGPGGRDRMLAVKRGKTPEDLLFSPNFFFAYIFYLCQNIGGNKFSRMEVSPKWVKSNAQRREKERETEEEPKLSKYPVSC